ncbi:hypothetical protein VPH35_092329 [Triticum aestivum]|uniref:Uncharacterized protein n=1 Tax=Triticum turgidum subsp. durum TaxID=4567 RepID=A0A9R0XGZ2_TRITD|nr:unnamed protein product [Triticum turgidum subsp. durum]
MNPKELFELFLGKERGEAIQDLEISQRAKGPLTQAEDATLRKFSTAADVAYAAASTLFTLPICFTINQAHKLVALPPPHRLLMLGYSAGGACVIGKLAYYQCLYGCAIDILKNGEERMKMELANIWRQRHSYVDNSFVEREKETEANNSTGARSISGQTIVDTIEKDPLACIGSPDINKLSVDKSTILTRQQLQAHRS